MNATHKPPQHNFLIELDWQGAAKAFVVQADSEDQLRAQARALGLHPIFIGALPDPLPEHLRGPATRNASTLADLARHEPGQCDL